MTNDPFFSRLSFFQHICYKPPTRKRRAEQPFSLSVCLMEKREDHEPLKPAHPAQRLARNATERYGGGVDAPEHAAWPAQHGGPALAVARRQPPALPVPLPGRRLAGA